MHTFLQVDDGPFLSLVVPLIALSSAPLSPGFFSFQCGTKRAQSKATIGLVVVALISLFVDTAGRKKKKKERRKCLQDMLTLDFTPIASATWLMSLRGQGSKQADPSLSIGWRLP